MLDNFDPSLPEKILIDIGDPSLLIVTLSERSEGGLYTRYKYHPLEPNSTTDVDKDDKMESQGESLRAFISRSSDESIKIQVVNDDNQSIHEGNISRRQILLNLLPEVYLSRSEMVLVDQRDIHMLDEHNALLGTTRSLMFFFAGTFFTSLIQAIISFGSETRNEFHFGMFSTLSLGSLTLFFVSNHFHKQRNAKKKKQESEMDNNKISLSHLMGDD